MAFKYPKTQEWDGDLRHLVFMDEKDAPEDWIYDWKESVGIKSAELPTVDDADAPDNDAGQAEDVAPSIAEDTKPKRRGRPKAV